MWVPERSPAAAACPKPSPFRHERSLLSCEPERARDLPGASKALTVARPPPQDRRMHLVAFKQVDVFTERAFGGNPVAVVLDGESLDGPQMQDIARWTNLSETAFVLPPTQAGADYRVRIFTPMSELPFAGHPSVGTAHALLESHRIAPRGGRLVQECAAGLLPMTVDGDGTARLIAVRAPEATPLPMPTGIGTLLDAALGGLRRGGLPPQLFENGPRFWLVELADADEVRGQHPDLAAIAALTTATGATGLVVHAAADADDHQRVVRCYCPSDGIAEDPVTGSANALIGAQLLSAGRVRRGETYVASQGREVGRDGRVAVRIAEDGVWIGGRSVSVIDGMIRLT
jgi:PhzF family phenazine biosynthesis protein